MKCPVCGSAMKYHEGEDEFSTSELHWYAEWRCLKCDKLIRDYEDEFEYPEDVK